MQLFGWIQPAPHSGQRFNGFTLEQLAQQTLQAGGAQLIGSLSEADPAGALLIVHPDRPLASRQTIAALYTAPGDALRPACAEGVHALKLLRGAALAAFCAGQDPAPLPVPLEDPLCCLSAEQDYVNFEVCVRATRAVSPQLCLALYEQAELPAHIRAHCQAVAALALEMGQALCARGWTLDLAMIDAGARLHDIRRLDAPHHHKGADWMRRRGYLALAEIVERHMGFDAYRAAGLPPDFDEATVVNLADKLVQETHRVTLQQRYAPALRSLPPDTELGAQIRADLRLYEALAVRYARITGTDLQSV